MKFQFSPHIAFQVRNYEKAIEFYEQVIGMKQIYHDGNETEFEFGKMHFHAENSDQGMVFFEVKTDDIDKAVALLTEHNCVAVETSSPEGAISYLITDPYGLRFHLFEE